MRKRKTASERSISEIIGSSFNRIIVWVILGITLISVLVLAMGQYSAGTRDFDTATGLAADRVYWALQSYKNIVKGIGAIPALSSSDYSTEEKQEILEGICEEFGLVRSKIINLDGYSDMDDTPTYRGDREYFKKALKGETYIQEPVTSRTDGQIAIIGAAPLWKNGVIGGEVAGVVFISINPVLLHNIIEGVDISKNTFVSIIDSTGTTVAASDMNLVYDKNNNIQNSLTDASYKSVAQVEKKMIRGETGSGTVRYKGLSYYVSYMPIKETPGWSICMGAPYIDYLDTPLLLLILMGESLLISIVVVRIRSQKIAEDVSEPIKRMTQSIKKAAEAGSDIGAYESSNEAKDPIEMKIISEAMDSIMDRLDMVTTDTREFLDAAVITDLVSMEMLKYIHGYYKAAFGVNVIVADSKGTVLVGKTAHGLVDANALRADESASFIMLNDRVIGSTIFKIPEECILNKEDAQQHAIYVSKILEIVAIGNFRRSLQNRNKLKHAKEELQRISEYHVEMGEEARKMATEGERVRKAGNADALKELTAKFIGFCYDIVSRTDDFTNFNERNDITVQIKEHVYKTDKLVNDLRNDIARLHPGISDAVRVGALPGIPAQLFGDPHRIRRAIENILTATVDEYSDNDIEIIFESKKNAYATGLSVNIHGNRIQTDAERDRLKTLLEQDMEEANVVSGVTASELKLLTIARVVRRMNGTITVDKGGVGETWCRLDIPQLEVDSDVK